MSKLYGYDMSTQMILVESWAPLVFNPSSPHYILEAVGYHVNAALRDCDISW